MAHGTLGTIFVIAILCATGCTGSCSDPVTPPRVTLTPPPVTLTPPPVPRTLYPDAQDTQPTDAPTLYPDARVTGTEAVAEALKAEAAAEEAARKRAGSLVSSKPGPDDPAKLDDSMSSVDSTAQATAKRVAVNPIVKGRIFKGRIASGDSPEEWYDDLGRKFGAVSAYFNLRDFKNSVDGHLRRKVTFIVIDMTGSTKAQISEAREYVDTLPRDKIIRVGF
jgi:hypothetical protein